MATKSQTKVGLVKAGSRSSLGVSSKPPSSKSGRNFHKKMTEEDAEPLEKEGALAFKVLSEAHTKELLEMTVENLQIKIAEIFNLGRHDVDLKEAAILDYFTSAVYWAKQMSFTIRQTSGFFTLLHTLLENVKERHLSLVDNMKELKKTMIGIGVDNPQNSGGLDFFDVKQALLITSYLHGCLFQHYKLYEFMFSHTQAEEIIGADLDVEVAKLAELPSPAPLDEGMLEERYVTYIATPPPSPEPEVGENQTVDPLATETDIFSELTPEDVREVVESVTQQLLSGLQTDLAQKLRNKENDFLVRINKIHQVADA